MKRLFSILKEKWPEYVFEIVVLVIGIYGAFALENLRDQWETEEQKKELLRNLKADFQVNMKELIEIRQVNQSALNAGNKLLQLTGPNYNDVHLDSLDKQMSGLLAGAVTYDGASGALSDMITNNKLSLIKDDSLRLLLTSWDGKLTNIRDTEAKIIRIFQEYLLPYLYEKYSIVRMDYKLGDVSRESKLAKDDRFILGELYFENILRDLEVYREMLDQEYGELETNIEVLLNSLEQEISN